MVVECYQGVLHDELKQCLQKLPGVWMDTEDLYKTPEDIEILARPYVTHDRIFGRRGNLTYEDYFDGDKLALMRERLSAAEGRVIVYGHGASVAAQAWDTLVYVDMARWEIQQRSRRGDVHGIGVQNEKEPPSSHYKRGYFLDWNLCDELKKKLISQVDFWLDTHVPGDPKMISGATMTGGLEKVVKGPFRVVPFFDPAPWGGQWMKEVCDLDKTRDNFGWCFDCVPEENSLLFEVEGVRFEMPANNLVFDRTRELLGAPVEARFGQDFPIRFDFLDTMGGGNLSLQVHPTTQYIRDNFGICYTQDESYYILDAEAGAEVYLGLKEGICSGEMIADLKEAQSGGGIFPVERYINRWPARKHDHFLIPAGTVHCSASGTMVLEISATPNIFTFKLWDWNRLGLDGQPRPINIEHGARVIQWDRGTEFTRNQLVNAVTLLAEGDGWREERTGLHENEFIETRRYFFHKPIALDTKNGVHVLNLVEGEEVVVESPSGSFAPYIVHYAETFIVPACTGEYTVRPWGKSEGGTCAVICAFVRVNA